MLEENFKFSNRISYAAERISKLTHGLFKYSELIWRRNHKALQTTFKGAVSPLLLNGVPVWTETMKFDYITTKYVRVQCLINIKIGKALRNASSEALGILAATTPIIIRTEEAVKQHFLRKGKGALTQSIDLEVEPKDWPHSAEVAAFSLGREYGNETMQVYTDGSRKELGSGQEWRCSQETILLKH